MQGWLGAGAGWGVGWVCRWGWLSWGLSWGEGLGWGCPRLTQLLDTLFVFDEQLDPGDVNVQPRALRWPLHGGVEASVVLAAGRRAGVGGSHGARQRWGSLSPAGGVAVLGTLT